MERSEATVAQFQDLNAVIHERTRLAILTYLVSVRESSFTELKQELDLTDGNLTLHMKALQKHRYVNVEKTQVERRPRTLYRMTSKGDEAFAEYVALLERILGLGSGRAARRRSASRKALRGRRRGGKRAAGGKGAD